MYIYIYMYMYIYIYIGAKCSSTIWDDSVPRNTEVPSWPETNEILQMMSCLTDNLRNQTQFMWEVKSSVERPANKVARCIEVVQFPLQSWLTTFAGIAY